MFVGLGLRKFNAEMTLKTERMLLRLCPQSAGVRHAGRGAHLGADAPLKPAEQCARRGLVSRQRASARRRSGLAGHGVHGRQRAAALLQAVILPALLIKTAGTSFRRSRGLWLCSVTRSVYKTGNVLSLDYETSIHDVIRRGHLGG